MESPGNERQHAEALMTLHRLVEALNQQLQHSDNAMRQETAAHTGPLGRTQEFKLELASANAKLRAQQGMIAELRAYLGGRTQIAGTSGGAG